MASSSWIWITPPRWKLLWVSWEFSHTENHKRKSSKSWMGFLVLEFFEYFWSDTGSLRRVTFPAYLDLCASFFHDWINETCVYLSLSAYAKQIHWAHHHHWKTAWAEWVPKAASARLEVIVMLSRLMNLYDSMFVERNLLHEMVLSKSDDLLILCCCRFKGIQYGSLAGNIASTHQFN